MEDLRDRKADADTLGTLRTALRETMEEINEARDNLADERRDLNRELKEKRDRLADWKSGQKSYRNRPGLKEARRELERLQAERRDDGFQTIAYMPGFYLYSGEEEISQEGYNNSFEPQAYLADTHTVYGAWRFLLRRPLTDGETVQLRGGDLLGKSRKAVGSSR